MRHLFLALLLAGCTSTDTVSASAERTAIECGYDQTLQIGMFTNTACKMTRPVTVMEQ